MKIKSGVRTYFRPFFNLKGWSDSERVKAQSKSLYGSLKDYFVPQTPTHTESFEEAMRRLNLTENDIKDRQREFGSLTLFMLVLTLGALAYTLYLLILGHYIASIIGFIITCFSASIAFRYHFWYVQVRERKLGFTLREWYRLGVLGKK